MSSRGPEDEVSIDADGIDSGGSVDDIIDAGGGDFGWDSVDSRSGEPEGEIR
jgi:hypothetical protein